MQASIIIPTFNRLWSLPDAIASCPRRDDIEIIVVDDGSTDGSWDWLQEQPGVRAIRQPNWGKPAAVNAGLAAARGDYVRFLDSDDLLVDAAVLDQLRLAQDRRADICVAGYWAVYEATGGRVLHDWVDCGDFLAQQLGECDSSHYAAYWFRRDFLAGLAHRPDFAFRDDRMFVIECALRAPTVAAYPEPTLLHRHHGRERIQFQPGSVAVVTNWQELQMYRKIYGLLNDRGLATRRRVVALAKNLWPLALRIAAYNRREARDTLQWMRSLDPAFVVPRHGVHRLYRALGFTVAQTIVNAARKGRNAGRGLAALRKGAA
ncbi:glycosyltransferase family 2 protein [Sphingomonas sp.]|uniref:glycosyltransferase family 2 protein n=1 Tax=Sphingomonas sp. TaxID=28214 RepID=UPI003CC53108